MRTVFHMKLILNALGGEGGEEEIETRNKKEEARKIAFPEIGQP